MDLYALSTKELVKHYNALVTESHPTLASITGEWKSSKEALITKIKMLPKAPAKANRDEMLKATTEGLKAKSGEALDTQAAKDAFSFGKKAKIAESELTDAAKEDLAFKPKAKAGKKGQSDAAIGAYFAKHNLNPKIMRAKLRRAGFQAPYTLEQIESLKKA